MLRLTWHDEVDVASMLCMACLLLLSTCKLACQTTKPGSLAYLVHSPVYFSIFQPLVSPCRVASHAVHALILQAQTLAVVHAMHALIPKFKH